MASVLTAFERLLRTLAFFIQRVDLGRRKREHIGDEDSSHAIIVDHKVLLPYPVDLLRLMDFDVIDQLIEHSGAQGLGSGVFADGGYKHGHYVAVGVLDGVVTVDAVVSKFLLFRVSTLWGAYQYHGRLHVSFFTFREKSGRIAPKGGIFCV